MQKKISILLVTLLSSCSSQVTSEVTSNVSSDNESISQIIEESVISEKESSIAELPSISESETSSTITKESDIESETSNEKESSSSFTVNENFSFPQMALKNPTIEQKSTLSSYSPSSFDTSTYKQTKSALSTGVDLYKCEYVLKNTNGNITVYCVEVDLDKANIVAGCTDNDPNKYTTKSVPTSQASAWENDHPGQKALAVTNADFFGSTCVNAFVKDGVILKDSHNQTPDDLPESSPMLFGICSKGARIGAMTTTNNQKTDYTSKLSYSPSLAIFSKDGTLVNNFENGKLNAGNRSSAFSICKTVGKYNFAKGFVYKVKFIQEDSCNNDELRGCFIEKYDLDSVDQFEITDEDFNNHIGYVAIGAKLNNEYEVNTYFDYYQYISSPNGGIWNYYDTILGCRHSLIDNGSFPATLAKETSNGASYRVPRSAVGIKEDGKVVIVSVEDLHYGGLSSTCTGLTLVELADFMRYFGCYDAANFDGGGSSQLSTKKESDNVWSVVTRSSDTGSTTPSSTRAVMNTIIVTTKEGD